METPFPSADVSGSREEVLRCDWLSRWASSVSRCRLRVAGSMGLGRQPAAQPHGCSSGQTPAWHGRCHFVLLLGLKACPRAVQPRHTTESGQVQQAPQDSTRLRQRQCQSKPAHAKPLGHQVTCAKPRSLLCAHFSTCFLNKKTPLQSTGKWGPSSVWAGSVAA